MAHGAHSSEHRSVGMSEQSGTCRVFGTGRKNEQKKKKKKFCQKKLEHFISLQLFCQNQIIY